MNTDDLKISRKKARKASKCLSIRYQTTITVNYL
jgi:hypothetical protein